MSKKKKRLSAEWPPSGLIMAGANDAWTNAKDWLCDAERLAQADGTPAHIVTLALYAEEEAAKAFTWALAYFAQIFLHLSVPLLEREMGPNLDDHAFRLYMAHFLEGMEVTTNGVEVFGISSTQLDDIVIEGSLETEEDLITFVMSHPQMLSVMQQFILQLSPDLDAEQARAAIRRMRTERNCSIYVDWNSEDHAFITPQSLSREAASKQLAKARTVVATTRAFLNKLPAQNPEGEV